MALKIASLSPFLITRYLVKKIMENVPGVSLHFDKGQRRMEQTRFSFENLWRKPDAVLKMSTTAW